MGFSIGVMLIQLIYLGLIGFCIYCLVLFVKVAKRLIVALDIYINEKKNNQ